MYVYITDMKVDAGSGSLISSGMSFHSFGPLIAKALSPLVFSLTLQETEQRCRGTAPRFIRVESGHEESEDLKCKISSLKTFCFVMCFVELCTYINPNVSNNVQTSEIHKLTHSATNSVFY